MQIDQLQLQGRALFDLTNRSKGGIYIYLGSWLLIGLGFGVHTREPELFYLNVIALVIIMFARMWQVRNSNTESEKSTRNTWNSLIFLMMVSALHWGILYALVISNESLSDVHLAMFIATIAFSVGGSSILSISNEVRIGYPILLHSFGIVVLFSQQNTQSSIFTGMSIGMLIYIYYTTKLTNKDYWRSITNELLSENRAREMEILSETDPLTGLKNRIYFDQKVNLEWKRGSRNKSYLTIMVVDLDNFKAVNDRYGHAAGDSSLILVARALAEQIKREGDCIARYGGEEFAVLLPDTSKEEARAIATRMLEAVRAIQIKQENENIAISCSIGGATAIPCHNTDYQDLIIEADTALYLAKDKGRDQYRTMA